MKIAYFDCFAGASGDMILGALLDAGLPLDSLLTQLAKLPLKAYKIGAERVQRASLLATQVTVKIRGAKRKSEHRSLSEILAIVQATELPERVKAQGMAIFKRLAMAEAKIHGVTPEEVHFHEVGALDAIVDVLGAVVGFHLLGVEEFYASPLPLGGGTVRSAHGVLPIPAPATLELLALAKAPTRPESIDPAASGELLTPTGVAIITTLAAFRRPAMTLDCVGHGAGARDLPDFPNVLRLWIGERLEVTPHRELLLLETNIDDMSPEIGGYVLDCLLAQGAYDVWFTPIQMKKNRPAFMLSVLAPQEIEERLVTTILRETSTLGVRVQWVQRHESGRDILRFDSSLGPVAVKIKRFHGTDSSISPEYEACRSLALKHNLPLQEVYRVVTAEAIEHLRRGSDKNRHQE